MSRTIPFQVKVCGVTSADQARSVAEAGADAIGLNFVPASRRWLPGEVAVEVAEAVGQQSLKVGLFVDAPLDQIVDLATACRLDAIQLHGDEPPELLADLPPLPILRAFRIAVESDAPPERTAPGMLRYLDQCVSAGRLPDWVLIDAYVPQAHGGTGHRANWSAAAEYAQSDGCPPLVLSGGLKPANVVEAVELVRPLAVDVSSGVESAPGVKDLAAVRAFVEAARSALAKVRSIG